MTLHDRIRRDEAARVAANRVDRRAALVVVPLFVIAIAGAVASVVVGMMK